MIEFFEKKKSWSKYKDLILDYYLGPYLAKVATLARGTSTKRPIAVFDCFAGPGRFKDGEFGSPLIILKHIQKLCSRGVEIKGYFIESDDKLFKELKKNVLATGTPAEALEGSFRDYVPLMAELARDHTLFIYVDPIKPGHLLFEDLQSVYTKTHEGTSIETLVNFLSTGFLRRILGLRRGHKSQDDFVASRPELIETCNQIAGGEYWQGIIFDSLKAARDQVDEIASEYEKRLQRWFRWVLKYAIREKYEDLLPKYHLIFGSRHSDAVDLMNRAMVKARREFVGARFISGMLFDNQPTEEVIDEKEILNTVLQTAQAVGSTEWRYLRANITIASPSMYTDSEINGAIKRAIREKRIGSTVSGNKVENKAMVWPIL